MKTITFKEQVCGEAEVGFRNSFLTSPAGAVNGFAGENFTSVIKPLSDARIYWKARMRRFVAALKSVRGEHCIVLGCQAAPEFCRMLDFGLSCFKVFYDI